MADVELNSIGNGDGTNYLVRDNTKIPLSGSNQISGDLVPATDNTVSLGSINNHIKHIYCTEVRGSDSNCCTVCGGSAWVKGAGLTLRGKDYSGESGEFALVAVNDTNMSDLRGKPNGTLTWIGKNLAMQENVVPRSGGAVMTGYSLGRTVNNDEFRLDGGTNWNDGASLSLSGKNRPSAGGYISLHPSDGSNEKEMCLRPSGTLTWDGQPIQTSSDQRLKQQITQIDDDLLTAWEDVNPVQFKYNDAVKEKSDNARLHTGYVVQQIDEACKSHGVDVSKYGLYCHEEYAEETREVEHDDGTKTTEVVRPASEHYSLRYTEALIVECAYLRKKNKDLQEQLNALSERLEKLENR